MGARPRVHHPRNSLEDLTVCITTFIRDAYLYNCIESLQRTYPQVTVSVADYGKHSASKRKWMKARNVQYHELPWDTGLSQGRNFLVDNAKTKYVAILDDDFEVDERANYPALLDLLEVADIAAGRYLMNGDYCEYVHGLEFVDDMVERGLELTNPEPEWLDHNGTTFRYTDLALNLTVMKTRLARKLAWDDRMKISMEHLDFFLRAKEDGYRVAFTPDSVFVHKPDHVSAEQQGYRNFRHRKDSRKVFADKWDVDFVIGVGGHRDYLPA